MTTDAYRSCRLCPRACGVDRTAGATGVCRVGANLRVARAALHLWEEPCLVGDKGSGAVFFSGCGLGCTYCQNRTISRGDAGAEISVERLSEIFLELEAAGAANVNLVTGTQFLPSILPALDAARAKGLSLPVVWNSGGYETLETLDELRGYADIFLPDFKYAKSETARDYSHAPDYPEVARVAIERMLEISGAPVFTPDGRLLRGDGDPAASAPGASARSQNRALAGLPALRERRDLQSDAAVHPAAGAARSAKSARDRPRVFLVRSSRRVARRRARVHAGARVGGGEFHPAV